MTYFEENKTGANYVYNASDTREFGWRASLKDEAIKDLKMEGIRCVNPDCDLENITPIPISDEKKLWSNPNTWPDGVVPTGGSVEVLTGENIIYDLVDSPIFEVVTINGRLTWLNTAVAAEFQIDMPATSNLNAKHIFIRYGELLIGSETERQANEASITLYGAYSDVHVKMSGTVEAGNKIIANVDNAQNY